MSATSISHTSCKHRLHTIRKGMKQRCLDPNHMAYHRYGGRSIIICADWMASYISFAEWAVSNGYKDDLTIDRIDNDGDYSPSNCRWITRKAQIRNSTTCKLTIQQADEIRLRYAAEDISMRRLAREYGVGATAIHQIINDKRWT